MKASKARGLCPLDPHQGLALGTLRVLKRRAVTPGNLSGPEMALLFKTLKKDCKGEPLPGSRGRAPGLV
jgi:hypothetical protein